MELTFQGGFVGTKCSVEVLLVGAEKGQWRKWSSIFPEDVNRKQTFDLAPSEQDLADGNVESVKLVFEESSDFFGRVTVYDLQIWGVAVS